MPYRRIAAIFLIFVLTQSVKVIGQTAETFGKNRVQYQDFQWSIMTSDNFEIYYYPQSKNAAIMAANYAEYELDKLVDLLGYSPENRIKLIVYATHSDLMQSNIGLKGESVYIGGYTVLNKNILEIHFGGNQEQMRKDVSRGIASLILNELFYSGNLGEVIRNTYFMSLPEWYLRGLVAYVSDGWSVDYDDRIRDLFTSQRIKKPNRFTGEDAETIGFSIWNFINEKYGRSQIAPILINTKISRSHEKGISLTLNYKYKKFLKEWAAYYVAMSNDIKDSMTLPEKNKRLVRRTIDDAYYGSIKISPDGTRIAYVQNNKGRYKVMVKNLETGKSYVVYRGGFKTLEQKVDYKLPVLSWRSNDKIGVISVKHDKMRLITYDIKEKIENTQERLKLELSNFFNIKYSEKQTYRGIYKHIRQVNNFNFAEDGATIVLSGENKLGQSDIYIYNLRNNNVTQITNDVYDDENPVFYPKSTKLIVFNSNRPVDTLQPKRVLDFRSQRSNHDLFLLHTDTSKVKATRITTTKANEIQPKITKSGDIYYISDRSGIFQLYKKPYNRDTTLLYSAYKQNIQTYDISEKTQDLTYIMQVNGRRRLFLDTSFYKKVPEDTMLKTDRQILLDYSKPLTATNKAAMLPLVTNRTPVLTRTELLNMRNVKPTIVDTIEVDINNYVFEFEKDKSIDTTRTKIIRRTRGVSETSLAKLIEVKLKFTELYLSSPTRYRHDFAIDNIYSSALKIDPLRGSGAVFGVNMSDIMAYHRFKAGLFGAYDFRTSVMWGEYEFLRKRTDFRLRFTKDALYYSELGIVHRYRNQIYEATASYPFNPMFKVSITPFIVSSRFINVSVINQPDRHTLYTGLRGEVTYDNVLLRGANLPDGFQAKLGMSGYYAPLETFRNFGKIYYDARHYMRVHKDLIIANRISGGFFTGAARKYFLLGGVDNWINGNTNQAATPLQTGLRQDNRDLLLHEFSTNLRGFLWAQLYGHSYLVYNGELRWPIFKYLIRKHIRSSFLRNFQLAGFYDVGTAWSDRSIFVNNINQNIVSDVSFNALVTNYSNPFLTGYGFGMRSMVSGTYTRLDVAWGVQDFVVQRPRIHLSFGYDF